jgi:hypothetical protein
MELTQTVEVTGYKLDVTITSMLHLRDGWFIWFQFGGTSADPLYKDFEQMIESVSIPSDEKVEPTTLPKPTVAPDAPVADKPDSSTEEVTLPTHQSPETQAPAEEVTATPASLYLIAESGGVIGLFDASGALLKSVNVFVMTLPEADRKALSVGIPASSWEEALTVLDRFS